MSVKIELLEEALKSSWIRETSNQPEKWSSANPALGQCVVSSLMVNEMFGGEIIRGEFKNGQTHYWNLVGKNIIDLTKSQFNGELSFERITLADISKLLANEDTANRFNILKKKTKKALETSAVKKTKAKELQPMA